MGFVPLSGRSTWQSTEGLKPTPSGHSNRPEQADTPDACPTERPPHRAHITRTLTLPPELLEGVGEEGVQVLAPYLQDPSAENVLRLGSEPRAREH